jgi:hypothetical protein
MPVESSGTEDARSAVFLEGDRSIGHSKLREGDMGGKIDRRRFHIDPLFRDVTILGTTSDDGRVLNYLNRLYDYGLRDLKQLDGKTVGEMKRIAPTTPSNFDRFLGRLRLFGSFSLS